ncbi:hypothetical protein [Streptomyces virginiae]|uniref:hypothetical protein n=1 Tax=Streptomyces virginiae TaxID=1961 RepID=UPI00332CC4E0
MGKKTAAKAGARVAGFVAPALTAALLLGAQPAAASGGDWGFGMGVASTALPGGKMVTTPALICNPATPVVQGTGSCSFTDTMVYRITTFRDGKFVTGTSNPATPGSTTPPPPKTFPLVKNSDPLISVGTCEAGSSHQIIECRFTGNGVIASGDSVSPGKQLVMWTPRTTCTPFMQLTWYDPAGEAQRWGANQAGFNDLFGANDWYVAKTFGRCTSG